MDFHQSHVLMESYYSIYQPQKEQVDNELYEQVLEFLINEGYVENVEEADDLMKELDEEVIDEILEGFRPTNYNYQNYGLSGPINPISRTAYRINNQIDKLKSSGKKGQAIAIDFVNRMQDAPEGRKESIETARKNRSKLDARARRDAQKDEKNSRKQKMNEELDPYDLVLHYLMSEGYADDEVSATQIMAHMSEEWKDEILEAKMEAEKTESEKKDIRGRRYAKSIGREDDYDKMGPTAPNWVAAQRRRNTKAMRGVKN